MTGFPARTRLASTTLVSEAVFVNTRGQVNPGEVISLEIEMLSEEWLELRGEVTSCQSGIGFGMVFTFLTDEEERILQQMITA